MDVDQVHVRSHIKARNVTLVTEQGEPGIVLGSTGIDATASDVFNPDIPLQVPASSSFETLETPADVTEMLAEVDEESKSVFSWLNGFSFEHSSTSLTTGSDVGDGGTSCGDSGGGDSGGGSSCGSSCGGGGCGS